MACIARQARYSLVAVRDGQLRPTGPMVGRILTVTRACLNRPTHALVLRSSRAVFPPSIGRRTIGVVPPQVLPRSNASSAGPAKPRAIGRDGAGACTMTSHRSRRAFANCSRRYSFSCCNALITGIKAAVSAEGAALFNMTFILPPPPPAIGFRIKRKVNKYAGSGPF